MAPQPPDPIKYETSIYSAGLHSHKPPFTFQSSEWESLARPILSGDAWGYVNGNAGAGSTYRRNLAAFEKYSIVPRRLTPSRKDADGNELFANASTTVLGQKLDFPIAVAPVGVQKIFHESGEVGSARAAASVNIPYVMSTASSTSIEDVGASFDSTNTGPKTPKWFQLYWPPRTEVGDQITISMLNRAKEAGFSALFVTLDTYVLGWRPSDMDHGYNPFIHADRIGVEIGFTDPVFRKQFRDKHGFEFDDPAKNQVTMLAEENEETGTSLAAREWTSLVFPGHSKGWEDVAFLQKHWQGPIVLKGIQSVADAKKAVEVGVQGIVVSNHGGRQQDGGIGSLAMLPKIVDAVGSKIDVLFDSGVRCGADVIKAVALGAKCVLVGRPYVYGLALGGEDGVRHVLRALAGEVVLGMHLAGLRGLDEVDRSVLIRDDEV